MPDSHRVFPLLLALAAGGMVPFAFLQAQPKDGTPELGAWQVPPGFVSFADPSNKDGFRQPAPGFKVKGNSTRYDATEFFEASGVPFPSGSEAIYDPNSRSLIVRNSPENLDLVDAVLSGCGLGSFFTTSKTSWWSATSAS